MSDRLRQTPVPPDVPVKAPDEAPGVFDKPRNVRLIKWAAYVAVLALFVTDFFLHYHSYLGVENVAGYYTVFGLVASFVLIGVAKVGGKGLKREEDYYDE